MTVRPTVPRPAARRDLPTITPLCDDPWWNRVAFFTGCCCGNHVYFAKAYEQIGTPSSGPTSYNYAVQWLDVDSGVQEDIQAVTGPGGASRVIRSLRCDPRGNVYGSCSHGVFKVGPNHVQQWIKPGFDSVEVTPAGWVYTIKPATQNQLFRYATDGTLDTTITLAGSSPIAWALAVDADGGLRVLVQDGSNHAILQCYDASHTHQWSFDTGLFLDFDNFVIPVREIAIDAAGTAVVACGTSRQVLADGTGGWFRGVPDVNAVCADNAGNWYINTYQTTHNLFNRVQKYNAAGALQWSVGGFSAADDDMRIPMALAWSGGFVYVAVATNHHLSDSTAYKLRDSDGSIVWQQVLGYTEAAVAARPGRFPLWIG